MPSFILALDTAHQRCSAALLSRDGEVSAWKSETVGNKHAERILALAAAEAAQLAPGTRLAVMNDARMQEAYSALYEVVEGPRGVREVLAPQLVKPADARRWLEEAKVDALCGSAAGVYAEAFNLPEGFPVHEIPEDMVMRIARLGLADEAEGRTMIPALASPLYVRDRVALTMQERARGERL